MGKSKSKEDIEFIRREKDEMVRKARQILDIFSKNELLSKDAFYEPFSSYERKEAEARSKQLSIDQLITQVSEHLGNIAPLCNRDHLGQMRMGSLQNTVKSALLWWHFSVPATVLRIFERVEEIEIDYSKSPFVLIDHYLPPPSDPQEVWNHIFRKYQEMAGKIAPQLKEYLSGREKIVPPQQPFHEAEISLSLYWRESEAPIRLESLIASLAIQNDMIPTSDELGWVFLRLRKRGWLVERRGKFGLTPEGRLAIRGVIGENATTSAAIETIKKWMLTHPS